MGKKHATSTSQVTIPPEVLARYNAVNKRAEETAATPFQKYGTEASDFVAQMNAQQGAGIADINATAGSYQPYMSAANTATMAGMGPAYAQDLNIDKYMSPYIKNVADATGAMMRQQQEQAQSGNLGTAISSGAFGGDRAGIAAANLQQQNQMAYGKTMADIMNQGYTQAVQTAQQQQGLNLEAEQANLARQLQGGAQLAGLGAQAQQLGLQGAQAKIAAGTLQQQTEQAGKDALIKQFMQEKGYPFQVAQYLANIAMGTGALSGSTTTSTQPLGLFGNLATGGRVGSYADGGGVAGPMSDSQQDMWSEGYVPGGVLPVSHLMTAEVPGQDKRDNTDALMKLASIAMGGGAKRGGAIDVRHGYATDGAVEEDERLRRLRTMEPGAATNLLPSGVVPGADRISAPISYEVKAPEWKQVGDMRPYEYDKATGLVRDPATNQYITNERQAVRTPLGGIAISSSDRLDAARDDVNRQLQTAENTSQIEADRAEKLFNHMAEEAKRQGSSQLPQLQFPELYQRMIDTRNAVRQPDVLPSVSDYVPPSEIAIGTSIANEQRARTLGDRLIANEPPVYPAPASRAALTLGSRLNANEPPLYPSGLAPEMSARPMQRPPAGIEDFRAAPGVGGAAPSVRPTGVAAVAPQPAGITGVAGAGAGYTDVIMPDGRVERREGARNWRNNNPGNIEYGDFAKAHGAVGSDGRFAVFPTYEAGRAAKGDLLFGSSGYKDKTIATAIERYAPASDGNNTGAYIASVASELGVDPNTPLAALSTAQREAMLTAMERVEGGGAGNEKSVGSYQTYSGGVSPATQGGMGSGSAGLGGADILNINKPYAERNMIGKFFHDPVTGKLDPVALKSVLGGLAAMAKSNTLSPVSALLQGLGGGMETYNAAQKQAADIASTQAATEQTKVETTGARFNLTVGGMPQVIMPDGSVVDFYTFKDSPELQAKLGTAQTAAIIQAAEKAGIKTDAGNAETKVYSTPAVQAAISSEVDTLRALGGDRTQSNEAIAAINSAAAAAGGGVRANTFMQLNAFADLNANPAAAAGGFKAPVRAAAVQAINYASSILGLPPISDMAEDTAIIAKASAILGMEAKQRLDADTLGALNVIMTSLPTMDQDPGASAKLMASIIQGQQRAVDLKNFTDGYIRRDNGNQTLTAFGAEKAFNDQTAQLYEAEKPYLETLIREGGKTVDPNSGMTPVQLLTSGQLSAQETAEVLAQLFPGGYPPHLVTTFSR